VVRARQVVEIFPGYDHKPAIMRAYKAADANGNGFIGRREFGELLHFLIYFNGLWEKFEQIDADHDGRVRGPRAVFLCLIVCSLAFHHTNLHPY
jgi:hypothetical protein